MSQEAPAATDSNIARFLVRHPGEVLRVLSEVSQARALVSAFPEIGRGRLLTTLLDVDAHYLYLECGAGAEMNAQLTSGSAVATDTHHEGVRVQFSVPQLEQVTYHDDCALRAPLPRELLRCACSGTPFIPPDHLGGEPDQVLYRHRTRPG